MTMVESAPPPRGVLLEETPLQAILLSIAGQGLSAVPNAVECGVLVAEHRSLVQAAATGPAAERLGSQQVAASAGPAVDAFRTGAMVCADTPEELAAWPSVGAEAAALGVRACLAWPLRVRDRAVGVLAFYAAGPFGPPDLDGALRAGPPAGVMLANAVAFHRLRAEVEQLHEALRSRDVIGQAKGVLMEREAVDADTAFETLRQISQSTNRKLREVAWDVAASAGPPGLTRS